MQKLFSRDYQIHINDDYSLAWGPKSRLFQAASFPTIQGNDTFSSSPSASATRSIDTDRPGPDSSSSVQLVSLLDFNQVLVSPIKTIVHGKVVEDWRTALTILLMFALINSISIKQPNRPLPALIFDHYSTRLHLLHSYLSCGHSAISRRFIHSDFCCVFSLFRFRNCYGVIATWWKLGTPDATGK